MLEGSDHKKKDSVLVLRNENEELRQSLLRLQENYQELQHERNFYRVKVSELSEIIETRDLPGTLVQKSLQNAELAIQLDRLKQELLVANMTIQKLGEQREQNKKMLLELSGVVRTLQSVPVEYDHSSNDPLENVKTKVETIMEDRRLLVLRCQELEQENDQKQNRLEALEAQFHLLNSMNLAKMDIQDQPPIHFISRTSSEVSVGTMTSGITSKDLNRQSTRIFPKEDWSASQSPPRKLFQDQNVFRTPSKNLSMVQQSEVLSSTTASSTSHPSDLPKFPSPRSPDSKPSALEAPTMQSSYSSPEYISDDSDEIRRLQSELVKSNQQHQHFKQVCQTAFQKMKYVEQEFSQMTQKCDEAVAKRDELKKHLKDVIEQYKELNQDYEQAMEQLNGARSQIKTLEKNVDDLKREKESLEKYGAELLENDDGVTDDVEKLIAAYLVARNTIEALKGKITTAEHELEEAEKRRAGGDRNYRDAVAMNRKLQHERKILETRIEDAAEQLQLTKKEVQKYKEEAKQARRRLTSYMRKEGISPPLHPGNQLDDGLLLPRLAPFVENSYS